MSFEIEQRRAGRVPGTRSAAIRAAGCVALAVACMLGTTAARPTPAVAQHFPSDRVIESMIRERIAEGRAVGMVIGVMEADGSTRIVSFGDSGPGAHPLGPRSMFEIGSITKVFTGILLADMAVRGTVALDDPVAMYLPEEVTMPRSSDGREITLLDLSTHRSGLPRIPDNMPFGDMRNPYADYTFDLLYEFLSNHEPIREIGAEVAYSNLGTGLLGHALARAADTDYEQLVDARIFEPLGMTASTITLSGAAEDWMVRGHDLQGDVTSLWDLPALAGAGAIRSNAEDMLRFLSANIGPAETDLERAMRMSHRVREEMSPGMGVGLNWITRTIGEDRIVWHNGGTGGFRTFIGFDPDRRVGAVVLTNSAHGADDIGFHLINPDLPLSPAQEASGPGSTTELPEQVEVPESVLERYVGVYELSPDFTITVTREGDGLFAQATGQARLPLFPASRTEFFLANVDARITFTTDAAGAVSGLVLHQAGTSRPARKVG